MKCPNCSSNEIITIQNENYCLSCGQQIPQVVGVEKVTTDQSTAAQAPDLGPAPSSSNPAPKPPSSKAAKDITNTTEPTISSNESGQTLPTPPASDLKPSTSTKAQVLQTKAGSSPKPTAGVIPVAKSNSVDIKVSAKAPVVAKPQPKPLNNNDQSRTPFPASLSNPHPGKSAINIITHRLWISVFFICAATVAFGLSFLLNTWNDLAQLNPFISNRTMLEPLSLQHLIFASLTALSCITILYLYGTAVKARIIYFATRQLDNRDPTTRLDQVATMSLWRLIGLDIVTLGGLALLAFAETALLYYGKYLPASLWRPLLTTIADIALLYALAGLIMSRALGSRTIVLAGQKPLAALEWGWRLFWHNSSDIAIWGTEAIAIAAVILSPLVAFTSATSASDQLSWWWLGQLVFIGAITGYFLLVFSLGFWSSIYFDLVSRTKPQERQHLLAGALRLKPSNAPLNWALITIVVVEIATWAGWDHQVQLANWLMPFLRTRI